MTSVEQFEDSAEHEAREGEVVKGGECLGEAFVVSGQAAESCGPTISIGLCFTSAIVLVLPCCFVIDSSNF